MTDRGFTIIVLAAQRDGRLDPLAAEAGVSHKCLVPIGGRPLLAHVMDALAEVEGIDSVRIVVEPGAEGLLRAVPMPASLRVAFVPAAASIADSVYAGAEGADGPVVVTTADNVLLTATAVRRVADRLLAGDDAVAALARKEDVLSAHPEGQRRFYRFRDGEFSNCNLYGMSRRGLALAETFREGGQFAKNPMRIARAVGFFNLLRLRYGLVTLADAIARLGRRFDVRASAIVLEDGAHAIDVDNRRTYDIAAGLLDRRAA
ncbi:MAG: nucleotidyl transferase [Alphaproteobacteria bacterium]|nr:MAG: nucleotidyl transferase [Alphaproteobacteria bacterium]